MSQFTSDEFLKSFLEEAGEYLRTILSCLLSLEESSQKAAARQGQAGAPAKREGGEDARGQINELLRALHSLKGISGMVGLAGAAELCHAMESILKPAQQEPQALATRAVNQLIEAAKTLEAVVQTVRDPALAMPDIAGHLAQLAAEARPAPGARPAPPPPMPEASGAPAGPDAARAFPAEIAVHLGELEWQQINAARAAGQQIALAYYAPAAGGLPAGMNVNQVRGLLKAQAQLVKAVPIIRDGSVRFAFVMACSAIPPAADLAFLEWDPIEVPEPAAAAAETEAPGVLPGFNAPFVSAATTSIRVDLGRMDELMRLVGDLVITRARISEALPKLRGAAPDALEGLAETAAKMERQVRTLREAVMRARLAPLSEVFLRMPLAVRDLGRSTGKVIQLMIEGGETEIDKALLDRLIDPLMHMVRNAVAHGIEAPAARAAAGKPAEGAIHLRGRTEGEHVIITVEDDGGGITVEQVRAKAKALGWLEDDRPLTNQDLLELLCRPGFSTQESADMGAGRGMGMNAAAEAIAEMGGTLALDTHPGQGARFTIQLPLTLTIIDAFIVEAGGERFAVPQSAVNEVIEVVPAQITRAVKHDLLPYRGGAIPLVSLHHVFGLPRPPAARWLGLVTGANDRQAALLVDQVLGLRETVVRPLADPLVAEPGISGATELGDGSVVLILNCHELIHHDRAARGWAGAA